MPFINGAGGGKSDAQLKQEMADLAAKTKKAQDTADNARQMVLNRDKILSDLNADTATLGDAISAAGTEHAQMREQWENEIRNISLTPGKDGKDGSDGKDGADSTVEGPRGLPGADSTVPGPRGYPGADSTVPGPPGKDSTVAGPPGKDGSTIILQYRDGIAVPAVLTLLGSTTVDVPVVWNQPFADTNYTITTPQLTTSTAALIGKVTFSGLKNKTASGVTVTLTTTALLSLGQITLSVLAFK